VSQRRKILINTAAFFTTRINAAASQPCVTNAGTREAFVGYKSYSFARLSGTSMSKSHSDPSAFVPDVTQIDCQSCGAKGYIVRRSPLPEDPAGEIRIYVCGECGERTEIVVKG
jgi:hypothetical protein